MKNSDTKKIFVFFISSTNTFHLTFKNLLHIIEIDSDMINDYFNISEKVINQPNPKCRNKVTFEIDDCLTE